MPKRKKELTDFEHQCLTALVAEYGPQVVIEYVQDISAQLAQDNEDWNLP